MERTFRFYAAVTLVTVLAGILAFQKFGAQGDFKTISNMVHLALGAVLFSSVIVGLGSIRDACNIVVACTFATIPLSLVYGIDAYSLLSLIGCGGCLLLAIVFETRQTIWRVMSCIVIEVATIWVGLHCLLIPWVAGFIVLVGLTSMWAVSFLSLRQGQVRVAQPPV